MYKSLLFYWMSSYYNDLQPDFYESLSGHLFMFVSVLLSVCVHRSVFV